MIMGTARPAISVGVIYGGAQVSQGYGELTGCAVDAVEPIPEPSLQRHLDVDFGDGRSCPKAEVAVWNFYDQILTVSVETPHAMPTWCLPEGRSPRSS